MAVLEYFRILKEEEIARRYFVMNSFDGLLTALGVIVAMFLAGIKTSQMVIVSCLGAAVSFFVSGVWSAYAAEKAEREKRLKRLEKHLLKDLDETKIRKKISQMSVLVALVNGFSPMLVILVILSPFVLSQLTFIPVMTAFIFSFLLILLILFLLGLVVGKIAEKNLLRSGLKMLSAGIVVGIIISLLQILKVI